MRRRAGSGAAWWFVGPALVVIAVFFFLPVLAALIMSLTDFDIYALADLRNLRFVGLRNYGRLLETPLFWQAFRNTLYFVIVGVPATMVSSCLPHGNPPIASWWACSPSEASRTRPGFMNTRLVTTVRRRRTPATRYRACRPTGRSRT